MVCEGLKPTSLIQVCETIENEKVWKRETESLLFAEESLGVAEATLLVYQHTETPGVDGITIRTVLDWLMDG